MLLSKGQKRFMAEIKSGSCSLSEQTLVTIIAVYAPQARTVVEKCLQLPAGSTVWQALQAAGFSELPEVQAMLQAAEPDAKAQAAGGWACGVWGKQVAPEHVLRDGDRVELYRPLLVDPKTARRERFARQGARTTGLFQRRRVLSNKDSA